MLVTGIAALCGFQPAVAVWAWFGLEPNLLNLGCGLAMLAIAAILLLAFRWFSRLTMVDD